MPGAYHYRLDDAASLNANNPFGQLPSQSDVVVVGADLHSLVYAIHARKSSGTTTTTTTTTRTSITVLEGAGSPAEKKGANTSTIFGAWLKTIGLEAPILRTLFGQKDGIAFYNLTSKSAADHLRGTHQDFSVTGPPSDFVPALQVERKVSELLLTLYAQRVGVNVFHGHSVDAEGTTLAEKNNSIAVNDGRSDKAQRISSQLLVDATGRLRRFAPPDETPFAGMNTDSFWAYFECDNPSEVARHSGPCNTNYICLAEGWAWVNQLPSWEGSSTHNLIQMINYLLDLNELDTPVDCYPSSQELAYMFDLKLRWITSFGVALRSDLEYPIDVDLHRYGKTDAECKFHWIVSQYPQLGRILSNYTLIHNPYSHGTTWSSSKPQISTLRYGSPKISGPGWVALGDAIGLPRPVYSPNMNSGLGTSIFAAELTRHYLSTSTSDVTSAPSEVFISYEEYCLEHARGIIRMNTTNMLLMRYSQLAHVGPLWQYLVGCGIKSWQQMRNGGLVPTNVRQCLEFGDCGAYTDEYVAFAAQVLALLDAPTPLPSPDILAEVNQFAVAMKAAVPLSAAAG